LDIRNPNGILEYGLLVTNADAQNGANHNIIKNCLVTLDKLNPNQTQGIRVFPAIVPSSADGSVNHNKFINNIVHNVSFGYYFDGNTSTTELMSIGNEVGAEDDGNSIISDIVLCGVYIKNQNGFTLHNTSILNLNQTGATGPAAISTTSGNPSEPLTNEFNIYNNKIQGIHSAVTSIYGIYINARKSTHNIYNNTVDDVSTAAQDNKSADGIMIFGTDIVANVYNNMVSGIAAPGCAISGTAATRGINVRTYSQANLFYNSVFIEYNATNTAHISAALSIHNDSNPVDLRNNIFVNLTTLPEGATGSAAAFFKSSAVIDNILTSSNNNIYYAGNPSALNPIFYGHSTPPAIDPTLEEYKLRASDFDQGSFTENVPFVSASDLHIQPLITTLARENALVITTPFTITTDIDGSLRNALTPDIGADEIANAFPDIASNPQPQDQAENVPVQLEIISWKYTSTPEFIDPTAFLVFKNTSPTFDGISAHASISFVSGQETYEVQSMAGIALEHSTTYYWKVVPTYDPDNGPDAQNVPIWSFTTEALAYPYPNAAENPNPNDDAQDMPINIPELSWDYIHVAEYTVPAGFKAYLGQEEELDENDLIAWIPYEDSQTAYVVSLQENELNYETEYFWKIVPTVDQQEGPDASDVEIWSFVTAIETFPYPNHVTNMKPAEDDTLEFSITKSVYDNFSFEYHQSSIYATPAGFKFFTWCQNETPAEEDFLFIEHVQGVTEYTINPVDYTEYFGLHLNCDYNKWKVVPTTNLQGGNETPDVEEVNFCILYLNIDENIVLPVKIYPNPSQGIFEFGNIFTEQILVEVTDLNATVVYSKHHDAGNYRIDLSSLNSGLYILNVTGKTYKATARIVIHK
jgi:hypothetical protein